MTNFQEILKKCEKAVADHLNYRDCYDKSVGCLKDLQEKVQNCQHMAATKDELSERSTRIKELLATKLKNSSMLHSVIQSGEAIYPSTGPEGKDIVRIELEELQSTFDSCYDDLHGLERDMHAKLSRWCEFDDRRNKLTEWLKDFETSMPTEIELHATLDEKRNQLQIYRTMLHDILSRQEDVLDLKVKAAGLPDGSEEAVKMAEHMLDTFGVLKTKAAACVEQYEEFVCTHQQYVKAVQDMMEFTEATHSTINLWNDENQDRINLNANLEKLKV